MKPAILFQLFFSVFILAIGGFAFYEYKKSEVKETQKEKSRQLLPDLKIEDIKEVRFKKNTEDKLSIIKKDESWLLLEPVQDLASFTELSRWIDTLARHKVIGLEVENPVLADYHLGSAPKVEIELKAGGQIQFSISSKTSFDGRWFIKKGGQIFLAEQGIDKELQAKNLEDFRSKKILPSLNHAEKIEIQGERAFILNWKDHKWSLEGRKESELPLDQDFLNRFWTDLTSLSASAILESKKAIKKYKLDKPLLKINLFYGEKKYVLSLSPQKTKLYAVISHRDYIFEISKEKGEELFLSQAELYDHSFPFDFESPLVSQIQITNQADSLSLKKKREKWILEKDSKKKLLKPAALKKEEGLDQDTSNRDVKKQKAVKKAESKKERIPDPDKIQDFLNQLKTLKAMEYKKAKESAPLRSIQLKNSSGELIFELKELKRSKKQSWLKSNLWAEWIALSKEEVDEVFNSSLLKEKTEKQ